MTKTLFFSDAHIPYTDERFLKFIEMACIDPDVDAVYGLGDTFDLLRRDFAEIIACEPGAKCISVLRGLASIKPVWLLPGNHDVDLIKWAAGLNPIEVMGRHVFCDGYLLTHGYEYDLLCRSLPWRLLAKVLPWWFKSPSQLKAAGQSHKYNKQVGLIHGMAIADVEATDSFDGIIMGHTHQLLIISTESNKTVADCGDFLDSASYLCLQNGQITKHKIPLS